MNQKLFSLLGAGVMFLGTVLFVFLLSMLFLSIQQDKGIDYGEEPITSRYIVASTAIIEGDTTGTIDEDGVDTAKQGVLKVDESRKVIKIESELTDTQKRELEEKYDIEFTNDTQGNGIYVVNISQDSDLDALTDELQAQVETDIPVMMLADTIDWGIARVGADKVWDIASGSGIRIGVIDTGVQKDHPDLVGNLVEGYDFVNNDTDANDDHGHGTHVAGIIGASFNQAGSVGVSNTSKIVPIKVLNAQGYGYLSDVAKGIYYAADNSVRVINLSLGSAEDSLILKDAVNYATNKGVLVVAAAGNNSGAPCLYPAAYTNAVCVVAIDSRNLLASFSNIGGELAAPGVYNYSTYIGSTYRYLSGTSMASPHVAGSAALLFSLCPTCTTSDIRTLLKETAVDLGEAGNDILFGYGLVDLMSAVAQLQGSQEDEVPVTPPDTIVPEPTTPPSTPKKATTSQIVLILEPIPSKGKKYIPTEVTDINVKYTLSPITEENNVKKVTLYLDNEELTSSTNQTDIFVVSKDLLNHSQHWIKVVAQFVDGKDSSEQIIIDMTYLRTLDKTSSKTDSAVLGISISIFDWLNIFNW